MAKESPRPFIKIPGGKSKLVPELLKYVPEKMGLYFEPFLGGGALFFALARAGRLPEGAHLADSNADLVLLWNAVEQDPEFLQRFLVVHKASREEFYAARARLNARTDSDLIMRAALLLYLNKTCFNGLWRTNKEGQFNVPWGGERVRINFDPDNLHECSRVIKSTAVLGVRTGDFRGTLTSVRPGDFVYADPPYAPTSATASFTGYTGDKFDGHDQAELAELLSQLAAKGARVVASNADVPEIRRLYGAGWKQISIKTSRSVAASGKSRAPASELILVST